MKRNLSGLLVAVMFCFVFTLQAQSPSDFEQMKNNITDTSLPLVNIKVPSVYQLSKENYMKGHITIVDPQARTSGEVVFETDCNVRYRGSSSLTYPKKSFAIKLIDDTGEDLDAKVLGIREENSWILDAMTIDRSRMRNRVLFDIWNETSGTPWETKYGNRNGTLGHFVEVFLNGNYWGLYCMTDKIDRKLLGLKKAKVSGTDVTVRGLQYKCEKWTDAAYFRGYDATARVDSTYWEGFELKVPEEYPSLNTWKPLMDLVDVAQLSNEEMETEYLKHFYKENLVDYMAFVMAFRISDNSIKNTYLSTVDINEDKRFIFTPWDLDASLGGRYQGAWLNSPTPWSLLNDNRLFSKLYNGNIDGYADALRLRWAELRSGLFSPERLEAKMMAYAKLFDESGAWQREYDRWNGKNIVPLEPSPYYWVGEVIDWYRRNVPEVNKLFGTPAGDVDLNGIVNGSDVTALYSLLLSSDDENAPLSLVGDVDANGVVNGSDVTALYNILLAE